MQMEEHLQRMSRGWRIGLALTLLLASVVSAVLCVIWPSIPLMAAVAIAFLLSLLLFFSRKAARSRLIRIGDEEE